MTPGLQIRLDYIADKISYRKMTELLAREEADGKR